MTGWLDWIMSPQTIYSSPNPWCLWTWPYLEIGCNQIKISSYWVSLGLNPVTSIFIGRGNFGHRNTQRYAKENAIWRWTQRLELCIYKTRNAKDCWQPPEARRQAQISPESSKRNQPCWHLDLGLLVARTLRRWLSVVLGHLVFGTLL